MYIVEGRPGSIERTAFLFSEELTRTPTTPTHLINAARCSLAVGAGWLMAFAVLFVDAFVGSAGAAEGLDSPYAAAMLTPLPLIGMFCAGRVLVDPDGNLAALITLAPFHLLMIAPNVGFAMTDGGWSVTRILLLVSLALNVGVLSLMYLEHRSWQRR